MRFTTTFSILTLLASVAIAHPGAEHEDIDTLAQREWLSEAQRSIADCQPQLAESGIEEAAIARRIALAERLRAERGLPSRQYEKRSFATVLATNHKSNRTGLTATISGADLFTGNINCVLQPEVTVGPYWVKGELVRKKITDGQAGVPLYTDYQIIDTNTCKPLAGAYLDIWHANTTGVYGGVVANGNGNAKDKSNLNTTHHRGIAKTDATGVAYVETTFPGHYTGRAPHIHVLATVGATLLANNTISGGSISHIGQVFFDQSLITTVEATAAYAANRQSLTLNKNDGIMSQTSTTMDPVLQYVWLGSTPGDGLLAWITLGVNSKASYRASAAATWTSKGGVAN